MLSGFSREARAEKNTFLEFKKAVYLLEEDVEEPLSSRKRPTMSGKDSDYVPEDAGTLSESSDFELTEKESSADFELTEKESSGDSCEISPRDKKKEKKKAKKEVSFAKDVTEIDEEKNSKFFNMDNILLKSKF